MASWAEVALRDMRIPGYAGSYLTSYAPNIANPWGRNAQGQGSAQATKASLLMGRYASPDAFDPGINPDYAWVSWADYAPVNTQAWPEILIWNQVYLTEQYTVNHLPGWINNTRVMFWDAQCWLKSKSTGQWSRVAFSNSWSGHAISADFTVERFGDTPERDMRSESSTGGTSVRLVYSSTVPNSGYPLPNYPYWGFHGYSGGRQPIDGPDIADVVVSCKLSLVVHDPFYADDREFARFTVGLGADYYPPAGGIYVYPGVGTSRHKLVTARWPTWEYLVMHTMTEAQFNAANGYPSHFASLSEGDGGTVPGGGGTDPTPAPGAPSIGAWFAKTASGENTWAARSSAGTITTGGAAPLISRRSKRRFR